MEWQVGDEGTWTVLWQVGEMRAPGQWSGKWEMRVDSGVASGR